MYYREKVEEYLAFLFPAGGNVGYYISFQPIGNDLWQLGLQCTIGQRFQETTKILGHFLPHKDG
ncbi:MAG: hypothetical protein SCALA701_09780 [Candidatus Scalindua sp.]|nr:MAG: hypothetical protein SCALA701_09780 [Candidatus Scalindua sp.]